MTRGCWPSALAYHFGELRVSGGPEGKRESQLLPVVVPAACPSGPSSVHFFLLTNRPIRSVGNSDTAIGKSCNGRTVPASPGVGSYLVPPGCIWIVAEVNWTY